MSPTINTAMTALAPIIWGSTYYVTTEFLPQDYPITVAMLRALPAGLLLLLCVREFPQGKWWARVFILGALNFTIFWSLLFISAYRLPGGIAATIAAIQPIFVIYLSHILLNKAIYKHSILASLCGIAGVMLLVLVPASTLDPLGIIAGLSSAIAMAAGSVLTRKWQPPCSLLTHTAWQLTAGGLLLLPMAMLLEPALPPLTINHISGLIWLSLFGAAFTYFVWFRGLALLDLSLVSMLGFLSPASAVMIGWALLDQRLSLLQMLGVIIVLGSIYFNQSRTNSLKHDRQMDTHP